MQQCCPICRTSIAPPSQSVGWAGYDCPRCGRWSINCDALSADDALTRQLGGWEGQGLTRRAKLSYVLRRRQTRIVGSRWVQLSIGDVTEALIDERPPSPGEQLDELILLVGDKQPSAGSSASLAVPYLSAWIGAAVTPESPGADLSWLLAESETKSLIVRRDDGSQDLLLRLTLAGWGRYNNLKKGRVESRRVLMAMKFDDPEVDNAVETCFIPAVRTAGFELRSLREGQPSGVIDDQLRVALRNSRFVIADLTHGSHGAYWEAGFAEGLGRPVIYTCRRQEWENERTHFDTNHLVTIVWDPANLEPAGKRLTATIRATLPAEATMNTDD